MNIRNHTLEVVIVLAVVFVLVTPRLWPVNKIPAITMEFPDKIQEVLPSVVHIMCDQWQGSGVAVTDDIIVTARHVIDGTDYTITLNDGTVVKGIQAISHKDYDVGFIKIDKPILKPAKFGSIKDCVLGQPIFTIGSPIGNRHFNSISSGVISNLKLDLESNGCPKDMGWSLMLMIDAATYGGNSGCPIFTLDGIVRGILVGGYNDYESLSYCIPSDLFLGDIELIKMMFAFNKYRLEDAKSTVEYTPYCE